jgi:hypothetical protein
MNRNLELINRSGESIISISNIESRLRPIEILWSNEKIVLTKEVQNTIKCYSLIDGTLIRKIRGGHSEFDVDFATETQTLYILNENIRTDSTSLELMEYDFMETNGDEISRQVIAKVLGMHKYGRLSVSNNGLKLSAIIADKEYLLEKR